MSPSESSVSKKRQRNPIELAALGLDLAMVGLAIINLSWIIFDSAWSVPELRHLMAYIVPDQWLEDYAIVHEHFFRIDLIFVSVFLSEFSVRWMHAIWRKRYGHFMAYPVLHWYDIIGCIPIAGFRWLRILRVFAILLRLQRLRLIDYTRWLPYQWGVKIYDVVMEEISDRVVIRVLGGVQDELRASGDLERKILQDVVEPRRELIIAGLRERIVALGQQSYAATREDLHEFVTDAISEAVRKNREIKTIDRIPVVGGMASTLLDHAITDIVCHALDELSGRLSSREFEAVFADLLATIFDEIMNEPEETTQHGREVTLAIIDILETVKQQVARRRWLEGSAAQGAATDQ